MIGYLYLNPSIKILMKKIMLSASLFVVLSSLDAQTVLDRSIHRIVFLGNSITYAGNYIVDVEAYIITHHPQQHFEFINVGLPSETASGLSKPGHAGGRFPRPDVHERLERVLAVTKPDLVFACYGMNDGVYLPFDEGRFQKYKAGIYYIHDIVMKAGAKIVHVTPPIYDELKGHKIGYANTLDRYADWIINQKKVAAWQVVDLHYPMKTFLEAHRKIDSVFHIASFSYAEDGVHPTEPGHWIMAKSILLFLGEKEVGNAADVKEAVAIHKNGNQILKLVAERQAIMKDAWLTAAGHKRPDMKIGLPLEEAKTKAAVIETQIEALLQ